MNDVDRLLEEAGQRWRAGQPDPPEVDPAAFGPIGPRSSQANLLVIAATGAAALLVLGLVWMRPGIEPGVGGQPPPASNASPGAGQDCDVTRPVPAFVPPSPYLASPPASYESDWFGTSALWTMIDQDGEVWKQSDLPHGPGGLGQKTFWWSADRSPQDDLEPAIIVTGTRLDGAGTFTAGPGTNASADFGPAMLVGVEFRTPGCWQLTGRYRDAVLEYIVSITDD
jgi:hypothetical protein